MRFTGPRCCFSAGIPLPRQLFVHGWITLGDVKLSKSSGVVVDPFELVERYGAETVRYYLTRHIHPFQDTDFKVELTDEGGLRFSGLEEAYTAGLANGIGNLMHRSLTMIEKNGGGVITPRPCEGPDERQIQTLFAAIFNDYERLMGQYEFSSAFNRVWEGVAALDGYINAKAPWALAKDPAQAETLKDVLYTLAEGLRCIGSLIHPTMPGTAAEVWRRLGLTQSPTDIPWEDQKGWRLLHEGAQIDKAAPLFPRLEA